MFGLRTIVVAGAAIMLLPSDPAAQQALVSSVHSNAQWALTYCEREPASCEQAKATAYQFGEKIKFAGRLAGDLIKQHAMTATATPADEPTASITAEAAATDEAAGTSNDIGHLLDSWEQDQTGAQ